MIGHGPAFIHSSKCITHSNRLGRAPLVTTSVGFSGERAAVAEVVVKHILCFFSLVRVHQRDQGIRDFQRAGW